MSASTRPDTPHQLLTRSLPGRHVGGLDHEVSEEASGTFSPQVFLAKVGGQGGLPAELAFECE